MKNWLNVKSWWNNWKEAKEWKGLKKWEDNEDLEYDEPENNEWKEMCNAWKEASDTWESNYYKMKELYDAVVFERDSYKAQLMDKQQEQERC